MIEVGVSPRGALLLCRMAKARAYLLGRDFAVSEDVQAVFEPVCAHRLIPTAKARLSGVCATDIARSLLQSVPEPGLHARDCDESKPPCLRRLAAGRRRAVFF